MAHQLINQLRDAGYDMADPFLIAETGWTFSVLLNEISMKEDIGTPYDLVCLLIGVNNQDRGQSLLDFEGDFRNLLKFPIASCEADALRVFVFSIPDYSVTPLGETPDSEAISKEIDQYNSSKNKIATEMGVTYFNITEISRLVSTNEDLTSADGLHPPGKMYKLWGDEILSWTKERF